MKTQQLYDLQKKSAGLAFFLALILGPLGLLYANVIAGVIMTLLAIATYATIIIPVIIWIAGLFMSFSMVEKHNKILRIKLDMEGDDSEANVDVEPVAQSRNFVKLN